MERFLHSDRGFKVKTILDKAVALYHTFIFPPRNIGNKPRVVNNSWQWCHEQPIPVNNPVCVLISGQDYEKYEKLCILPTLSNESRRFS